VYSCLPFHFALDKWRGWVSFFGKHYYIAVTHILATFVVTVKCLSPVSFFVPPAVSFSQQPVSFVLCASTEWTSCPHVVVLGSSSCDLWSQRVKVFYFHRAHFFQIPSLSAFSLLSCHLSFLLPTCRHLAENISLFTRELIATVAAVLLQVAGCRLPGCCLIS